MIKLKKYEFFLKNPTNEQEESLKPELVSQILNLLNLKPGINQEAQFNIKR